MSYLRFLNNGITLTRGAFTPTVTVSSSRSFTTDDIGNLLIASTGLTLTMDIGSWLTDAEVFVVSNTDSTVLLASGAGVTFTRYGGTSFQLGGRGAMVGLKLIASDTWILTGDFL